AGNVAAAGLVSPQVAALADAGVKALGIAKLKVATALVAASVALGGVGAAAYFLTRPVAVQQDLATSLKDYQELEVAAAFSPKGGLAVTASADGTSRVWDLASRQARTTLDKHDDWVTSVSFSPDGATLATASWDSHFRIWDVATGRQKNSVF